MYNKIVIIKKIDGIIKRTIDTLTLTRENFYSPLMNYIIIIVSIEQVYLI